MTVDDATPAARMAQCSITGKMVPEDELVTIQGHRVCAEGKAILLDRLKSGEALPGEKIKPTVLRRFCCIFVDGVILWIADFVISMSLGGAGAFMGARTPGLGFGVAAAISFISTTIGIIYFGQMHASGGQTLGKKAGKLVVINRDGSPISVGTAYVRSLAYCGPGYISGITMLLVAPTTTFRMPLILSLANLVVLGWRFADVLLALFDRSQQRSLHDRIAGTRVVEREA